MERNIDFISDWTHNISAAMPLRAHVCARRCPQMRTDAQRGAGQPSAPFLREAILGVGSSAATVSISSGVASGAAAVRDN